MKRLWMLVWAAVMALGMIITAQALETPDVNGCISMTGWDRKTNLLSEGLDVDGDGVQETGFFDQYANMEYQVVAFFRKDAGNDQYDPMRSELYLCPGITYCDKNGFSKGNFADGLESWDKEYLNLSLLTGDDGWLYACVDGVIFGANGLPESYPEFFVSDSGRGEMQPMEAEYQSFLVDAWNGMAFLPYPIGFRAEYVDALGRWCLVMEQASEEEYASSPYRTLKTCFSISDGRLQKVGRLLDGERVE